ncbi:MAG: sigma-70 family RNA polymerase sigma factor [Phycisphaerales bacterium]|nr:sigma-70 family RNA polymerase sigma factor [Phycisphaerales bacterium]
MPQVACLRARSVALRQPGMNIAVRLMPSPTSNRTPAHHDLLSQAQAGNADALAELLDLHAPRLRHSLAGAIPRRWQSLLSVDDVMQQAFADAFLDISQFESRGGDSFFGWLSTIARHNLLNALKALECEKRGGNHRPLHPATTDASTCVLLEILAVSISTPSAKVSRNEGLAALQDAIQRLPITYRTVVRMYDLDGIPVDEVAARLKRSPGAIFMLRARAHRMLARLMGSPSMFFSASS